MKPVSQTKSLQVRTVTRFDQSTGRDVQVSREVADSFQASPSNLPPDAQVEVATFTSEPADPEHLYQYKERVDPEGQVLERKGHPSTIPDGNLFLAEKTTIQYSGSSPAVLFQEELRPGLDDYQVQLLSTPVERARYIRADRENYSGQIAESIAKEVAQKTPESVREWDQVLSQSRGKFLQARYGDRQNMSIVEVGPGTTGIVARSLLKSDNGNQYFGIDHSPEALEMQQSVLLEDGFDPSRMTTFAGDATKSVPVPDASQDLVVGYASIGTWGPTEEVNSQFDEFARILKPGGELMMGGMGLEQASPPTIAHILGKFELVPKKEDGQQANLILKRRAEAKEKS